MPIVSFDFDGVLHQNVKVDRYIHEDLQTIPFCYGPANGDYTEWENLKTNPLILDKIEEEIQAGNTLIIVSARDLEYQQYAMAYLNKLDIIDKFQSIRFGCKNKVSVLQEMKAIRHYEDSLKHIRACREAGIKVIQIYPLSQNIFEPNYQA